MKRLEVILKNHNRQMFTHYRLVLKNKAPEDNPKVLNETMREIEGYIKDQIEMYPIWAKCIDEKNMIDELDKWIKREQ